MGVCTSMEDAIMYTQKLQKQSDMRGSKFPEEHYAWTQLPLIEHKDVPSFKGNIGFKRIGSYTPLNGWHLAPIGLVDHSSTELLIDYTDKLPDVQFEIGFLHLISTKRIDILHHKVPHREMRRNGGTFKHFDIKRLLGRSNVAREFTHLVGLATICVLIGYSKHFVGIKSRFERDVT